MVAANEPLVAMDSKPCITVTALGQPTTIVAQQGGRITSPVQEKKYLLLPLQCFPYGFNQWRGKPGG